MHQRAFAWLMIIALMAPLAAVALFPEALMPLIARAVAYPWSIVWLVLYDAALLVHLWTLPRAPRQVTAVTISALALFALTASYALHPTNLLLGLSLIVPPLWAIAVASFLVHKAGDSFEPPNQPLHPDALTRAGERRR